jgi:hypothetical protein
MIKERDDRLVYLGLPINVANTLRGFLRVIVYMTNPWR